MNHYTENEDEIEQIFEQVALPSFKVGIVLGIVIGVIVSTVVALFL